MNHNQFVSFQIKQQATSRSSRLGLVCALAAAGTVIAAVPADAHVTKIQITAKESPTFGGYSWPGVGQYEKIVGKAFGELDPKDPKNAVIVDLQLAPRNCQRQSRILVRLLHSEADRPRQGQSQDAVRAAEPRQKNDRRAQSWSRRQRSRAL